MLMADDFSTFSTFPLHLWFSNAAKEPAVPNAAHRKQLVLPRGTQIKRHLMSHRLDEGVQKKGVAVKGVFWGWAYPHMQVSSEHLFAFKVVPCGLCGLPACKGYKFASLPQKCKAAKKGKEATKKGGAAGGGRQR